MSFSHSDLSADEMKQADKYFATPDQSDVIYDLEQKVMQLEDDCMTMALRLLGEDESTFAPETYEVMQRWGKKAYELLQGDAA